ncbi:LPS translocon maturation chaperone LptM [Herbaspirillum frisingense]|uniref:LPS translocon maturation chaperone LptM n=1 Tax=Herbaspirillum frisingense TaxID=92645 RepID=UPI000587BFCC|nr:lipoprotein [Herbaspirillum frisingense]
MKSHYSPVRRAASLALCAAVLMLAGCGQKGPLYMPKVPPDPFAHTQPKPAAPQPDTKAGAQQGGDVTPAATDAPAK